MKKITKTAAAALAASVVLGLTACAQGAGQTFPDTIKVENSDDNVVTVQTSEEVKVVPDMAEIVFAVTTQAEDAKSCQEQNAKDLENVINFLKGAGIAEPSIQTSNYGLEPVYDWNTGRTITGYEMRTNITVSDIAIDKVGELLSSSVEAGINSIQDVSYLSSQYDESYQQALKAAVEAARVKANSIAEASGCILGPVVHVEEYNDYQQARYTGYRNTAAEETMAASDAMAVAPGQITITARVTVDFEIQ